MFKQRIPKKIRKDLQKERFRVDSVEGRVKPSKEFVKVKCGEGVKRFKRKMEARL